MTQFFFQHLKKISRFFLLKYLFGVVRTKCILFSKKKLTYLNIFYCTCLNTYKINLQFMQYEIFILISKEMAELFPFKWCCTDTAFEMLIKSTIITIFLIWKIICVIGTNTYLIYQYAIFLTFRKELSFNLKLFCWEIT